ncbi:MAG: alpha/beta fold hydrolase [Candidatus Sericytochromatia bacterium]
MNKLKTALAALILAGLLAPAAPALEQPISFEAYRQQSLDGKIAWPEGTRPEQVKDWIILLHGSGAQNMDEELAEATAGKQSNPFFKSLSDRLIKQGFGVIRYDKRSYVVSRLAQKDPAYVQSEAVQAYIRQPLSYLIEDAKACVRWARQRYPAARIHVLGHSEGTYLALQLAQAMPQDIQGVGLVGFYDTSFDTTVFEQSVYRPQGWFDQLDRDHDHMLSAAELSQPDEVAMQIKAQLAFMDLDKDQQLSRSEFRAASFSNLLLGDLASLAYRQDEASYPRPHQILPGLKQPVLFFVGSLDNQTAAYQTQAVEMANKAVWKKNNLFFTYFPGLGHGLDKRSRYEDLIFQLPEPTALETVAVRMRQEIVNR